MFEGLGQLFFISMSRVALHTLGCKLNFAETATIARQFAERGFEVADFGTSVDVVVLNTCTVTEKADRECRQFVRRALRHSPGAYVIVTGCYAQLQPEQIAAITGVDLVLGSKEKFSVFEHATFVKGQRATVYVSPVQASVDTAMADSSGYNERTRAFLKIQDGCDYQCSFCTIPLARGSSRSAQIPEFVERANRIAEEGYREVVLTGVNVGDYESSRSENLIDVLNALESISGIERIRISSIEPNLLPDGLLRRWIESPKVCNHFHIPLQSGSDSVLKAMRRRYNREYYAGRIGAIKAAAPDAGIGADVIVGFPGETDQMFEETYQFLTEQPLSYLHVFAYSERSNTRAVELEGKVEVRVRNERSERLRILSEKKRRAFCEGLRGTKVSVLFETPLQQGIQSGLTEEYVRVQVPSDHSLENEIHGVLVNDIQEGICIGQLNVKTEAMRISTHMESMVA